jgi:outer membrane protein assembly factor BamB
MRRRSAGLIAIGAAVAIVALVAAAVVAYRVFASADVLTAPTMPYPTVPPVITDERPFSELRAAPLVVEDRLRIYAETWRVWADAPVGERYESTPYWAFRRWPAQVLGVVTAESAAGPMVVTQWSDGQLIAIDARKGALAWRTSAPVRTGRDYDGRRTGAATVYDPESLLTVRTGTQTVVVVTAPGSADGFDAATGRRLWHVALPAGCEQDVFTSAGLVAVPSCDGRSVAFVAAADGAEKGTWTAPQIPTATGRIGPALCELSRFECRLITVGTAAWTLEPDGQLDQAPPLEAGAVLSGDRVVYPIPTGVQARPLTSNNPLWTWQGLGHLVAADAVGVYIIAQDRTVLGLSPATGRLDVVGCASSKPNEDWQIGHVYPTGGGYLALERITKAPPSAADAQYFFGPRPVALVELYPPVKVPVWPGKFAACNPV